MAVECIGNSEGRGKNSSYRVISSTSDFMYTIETQLFFSEIPSVSVLQIFSFKRVYVLFFFFLRL